MQVRALLLARALVVFALFPALAGCIGGAEPLDRADLPPPPEERAPPVVPWASPEEAEIRPGSVLRTEARDCPTHFFFLREDNGAVFVGTTSYCVRDLPIGSLATLGESQHLAVLVYSSFQTMAELGERDPDALEYNDLAVFHLDSASRSAANPQLPGGGPRALADGDAFALGDRLRAFARGGGLPSQMEWRESVVAGRAGEHALLTYTLVPGAPGTLGGPVVDPSGNAVGVLATLGVFPNPGANGVARLDTMLAYARDHAKLDMTVATWEDTPTASRES